MPCEEPMQYRWKFSLSKNSPFGINKEQIVLVFIHEKMRKPLQYQRQVKVTGETFSSIEQYHKVASKKKDNETSSITVLSVYHYHLAAASVIIKLDFYDNVGIFAQIFIQILPESIACKRQN